MKLAIETGNFVSEVALLVLRNFVKPSKRLLVLRNSAKPPNHLLVLRNSAILAEPMKCVESFYA